MPPFIHAATSTSWKTWAAPTAPSSTAVALSERVILADSDKIQFGDSILMQYRRPGHANPVCRGGAGGAGSCSSSRRYPTIRAHRRTAHTGPTAAGSSQRMISSSNLRRQRPRSGAGSLGCGCIPFHPRGLMSLASLLALDAYQQRTPAVLRPLATTSLKFYSALSVSTRLRRPLPNSPTAHECDISPGPNSTPRLPTCALSESTNVVPA